MARYSFDIKVEFVRSEENVAADAVSRGEWERFYSFMRDTTGLQKYDIVMLGVQEQVRCDWSSKLRSIRILQERITKKQEQGLSTGLSLQ